MFKEPLESAGFNESRINAEWRSLKALQKTLYTKIEAAQLWEKVLAFRRKEFPNLSLLVELSLCISASNSTVERVFSILTQMLSDRRLSMRHDLMENLLMISANDANWSNEEREALLRRAVDLYTEKRRTAVFPKPKQQDGSEHHQSQHVSDSGESDDDSSSTHTVSDSDTDSDSDSDDSSDL